MDYTAVKAKLELARKRAVEQQLERLTRLRNLTGETPAEGSKPQLVGTDKSGNTKGNAGGKNTS